MPIPWLIGAAVVAVVAAVANSVSEDAEKERQEKERRAAEEEARINTEAEARREDARREYERQQEQERIHGIEMFSYEKASVLVEKYAIQDVSLDEMADLAVCNPEKCEDVFNKAFIHSAKYQNMNSKKNLLENQLWEIDELSKIISNVG